MTGRLLAAKKVRAIPRERRRGLLRRLKLIHPLSDRRWLVL
jgi:hypothetical protein